MAVVRTGGTASSSVSRCSRYDVFLSFRGEDTRRTFTDHLYRALLNSGIHTFRDDDELERGENIQLELEKAIEESRVSVIVFSKGYASSRWCLDELVNILERRKGSGHHVLPVFYDVAPSNVGKQNGSFEEAFPIHQGRFDEERLKRWRAALDEVAELGGMELQNRHESSFIMEIIREVGNKLNRRILNVPSYLIGIDSHIEKINSWLQGGSTDVGILVIYGIGGIGKTTIAKIVYNMNYEKFDGSSFLANIGEASRQPNGLVSKQEQFLSNILKWKNDKIYDVDEGVKKIKDAISHRRVLLVLDDVDRLNQLDALLYGREWFYPGSKIIITARCKKILKTFEPYETHEVKELSYSESIQLFNCHAFKPGQWDHPIADYMDLSRRFVNYCGGNPLALQVLGRSLCGEIVDLWESRLQKLEEIPNREIHDQLIISFNYLQDDQAKNLFLDVACFFVGQNKDFVIIILDQCYVGIKYEIDNLIDRCLLTIDEYNKVTMHQLIQDMGREIVRQESIDEPGKRSRLWGHKDALNVVEEISGTGNIQGIILNLDASKEEKCGNSLKQHRLDLFSLFRKNFGSRESPSASNRVHLKTCAFSPMHKLRILHLNNVQLTGGYQEFPKKLRWLRWHGFYLNSIPNEFLLESLVVLEMCNSSLEEVWEGNKLLRSLKILDLSYSHGLVKTPDFSEVPNLVNLILKDCIQLIEIHESIGELRRLGLLNLKDCKNLRKLPISIGRLKSLEELIVSGCSNLSEFPTEMSKIESLRVLKADKTAINALSLTTDEVKSWRSFTWYLDFWHWVSKPRESPKPITFSLAFLPGSLTTLSLENCNLSDDAIPRDFRGLFLLQNLNLSGNPICSLPESIKYLTILKSVNLRCCKRLQSLPNLPMSLEKLNLEQCMSLEKIMNLPNLASLQLNLSECVKLVEVQGMFKLEPFRNNAAEIIGNVSWSELESMGSVEVHFNPLQEVYDFGVLSTCLPLSEVPSWFEFKSIIPWAFFYVPSLPNQKIEGLDICTVYCWQPIEESEDSNGCFFYIIYNVTKHIVWKYQPRVQGIPAGCYNNDDKCMMWLSYWKIGNHLEGGDEVSVSFIVDDPFQLKEIGIHVVFDEEDRGSNIAIQSYWPLGKDASPEFFVF